MITRCYKCGKKIIYSEVHVIGLADDGDVVKYTICSDCRDVAIKNFKEFMEEEVEDDD